MPSPLRRGAGTLGRRQHSRGLHLAIALVRRNLNHHCSSAALLAGANYNGTIQSPAWLAGNNNADPFGVTPPHPQQNIIVVFCCRRRQSRALLRHRGATDRAKSISASHSCSALHGPHSKPRALHGMWAVAFLFLAQHIEASPITKFWGNQFLFFTFLVSRAPPLTNFCNGRGDTTCSLYGGVV